MKTYAVDFDGRLPIDGYAPGGFRVGGRSTAGRSRWCRRGSWPGPGRRTSRRWWNGPVPSTFSWWEPARRSRRPEGLAAAQVRLEAAGAGVEFMSTPSACRTYNVLLGEGRRVAAALIPV